MAFAYYRLIHINADTCISSALSDAVVSVKFNSTDHADLFDGDDGDSVRFSSDDAGETSLDHECVVFSETEAIFYVKCDLSASALTVIYFWYGDTANTGEENATAVWTNAYAIYHLEDASDSSGNARTLTDSGVTYNTGLVGKGATGFSSTKYLKRASWDFSTTRANNARTTMVWVKPTNHSATRATMVCRTSSGVAHGQNIFIKTTGYEIITYPTDGYYLSIGANSSSTNFELLTSVSTAGTTLYAYLNDNNPTSTTTFTSYSYSTGEMWIGEDRVWTAPLLSTDIVDEVWCFTDVKSANFIKVVYNNHINYDSFIDISDEGGFPSDYIYTKTFTSNGTFYPPEGVTEVEVLVVGGGGQSGEGDTTTDENGGGGGAGGLVLMDGENKYQLTETEQSEGVAITIGAGGAGNTADTSPGASGGDSTFGRLTAKGGGGGGGQGSPRNGAAGGSGGGGGCDGTLYGTGGSSTQSAQEGDSGTYGFGNAGGTPNASGVARGGGGAGGAPDGATGGAGKTVWGTTYAKGGTAQGDGGDAAANTGNGADSRANSSGSDGYSGGSGIVVVRFVISSSQQLEDTVEFTANFAPSVTKVLSLVKSAAISLTTSTAFTKVLTLVPDVAITSNFTLVEGTLYTPVSISTSSTYEVSKSTMFGLNVPFTETVSAAVSQVQTLYTSLNCTVETTISSVTIGVLLFDTCEIGITGSVGTPTATQSLVSTIPIDVNASLGVTPIQTLYQSIDLASIYNIDSVTYGTWILDSIDIGTTVGISATQIASYLSTVEFTQTDSIAVAGVSSLYSSIDILPTYSATANVGFSETVTFTATKSININTYQEIEVNISPTYSILAAMGRIYMETVLFTTNVYTSVTPVTTGLTLLSWNIIVTREGQVLNLADLNIVTSADFTDVMGNRSGSFEIHILNPNGTNDDIVRIGDDVYLYVDEESPATRKVFHGKITTIDYTRNSFGAYDLVARGEDYGTLRFKQTVVTGVNDYVGWLVSDIVEDILTKFCPDITTTNVESADFPTPIDQIRVSWEYVGEAIEKLASIVGASFYVDEDNDLHFYDPTELVSQHNIKDRNIINAKIRRDASKAFDKIMVIGGKQKTIDQSATTVTHQSSAINDRQLAFSFTPTVTNLFTIDMHIDKIGIVSEDIQFSIVEDNSGAPTGSAVAYGSFSSANITDTPAWISSDYFDAVVDITKTYWVVIAKCGANSSNTYKFSCDDTATSHKYNTGESWSDATGILAYKTYYGIQVIKISNADTKIMGSYYSELPIFDNSIKDSNTAALLASKKLLEYTFQTASDYVVNTVGTRYVPGEIATISTTIPNAGEQTFLSVKYIIDSTRIANIVLTCTKADDLYSTFAKMFADLRKVKAEQLLAGQASGIDYVEETEDSFNPVDSATLTDNIDADPEYDKETTLWGLFTWA